MDKKQMLDRIYEVIADKTFNYWLNIVRNNMSKEKVVCIKSLADWRFRLETFAPSSFNQYWVFVSLSELEEIRAVWHPVMIGDVLEYSRWDVRDILQKKHNDIHSLYIKIMKKRSNKRKPIEDQPDECIKFVYDLLPTK